MKKRLLFIFILMVVMIVGTACGEPAEPAGQNGSDIPAVEIESLLNRQGSFELVLFTSVVDVDGRMAVCENIPEGVSDRLAKAIGEIYDIVSGLTCYGENNWELIDMGDSSEESMLNRVRQGRYLTFITPDGLKIDELKYTAASGTFYEYGGIAYNPLTAKEKEKVDEILGIE